MMRLTIIPSDGFVSVNDIIKHQPLDLSQCAIPPLVHALQWFEIVGWIEFKDNDGNPLTEKQPNENITELPQWALNCVTVFENWHPVDPPPPSPPTAEQNKITASGLLQETDWTQIPSVSDPQQSTPYLTNAFEFATYRTAIREIAINPIAGYIDWPQKPSAIWS